MKKYKELFYEQLAADFCCRIEDVADTQNHFTVFQFRPEQRKWQAPKDCFLKIAAVNGKLLFSGREDIIGWCARQYQDTESDWFFEAKNMHRINERIRQEGYQIEAVHPFFLPDHDRALQNGAFDIRWYEEDEIGQFRGDPRYKNAFSFCEEAPDMLGVAAFKGGVILGMAGASRDSDIMWQIGIDVERTSRQHGVGQLLVSLLKHELLQRGVLPFYGTAMSHIGSQKVALRAGFLPAWAELGTSGISSYLSGSEQ